jgi:hypothetical protein
MRFYELLESPPRKSTAGIIKPKAPMTPAEARAEAERRAGVQQRIQDTQQRNAKTMRNLRAKLV